MPQSCPVDDSEAVPVTVESSGNATSRDMYIMGAPKLHPEHTRRRTRAQKRRCTRRRTGPDSSGRCYDIDKSAGGPSQAGVGGEQLGTERLCEGDVACVVRRAAIPQFPRSAT